MITNVYMKENKVFIALGTNLGNREENLNTAISEIAKFATIKAKSSIYETDPVGYRHQGKFLNMAIEIHTTLEPKELLTNLQQIENKMGRVRKIKNGPRIIDLDILLYEDQIIKSEGLDIPHPLMTERKFVLEPLNEIASDVIYPLTGVTIYTIYKNL